MASFVVMFFLMRYLLFFTLRDGGAMVRQLQHAIPLPDEQKRDSFDKFTEVSRATIKLHIEDFDLGGWSPEQGDIEADRASADKSTGQGTIELLNRKFLSG